MRGSFTLAVAGAVFLTGGATAQTEPASPIDPNLRCAIWAAVAGGSFEQGPERATYDSVFTYFMGKFEGATGERIETAMTPHLIITEVEDWLSLMAACETQALELGERLIDLGANLHQASDGAGETIRSEEAATSLP